MESTSPIESAKELLTRCEQTDLLALLETLPAEKQVEVAERILKLNSVTPTGMEEYLKRARKLLADSAANVNPFDEYKPEVPTGVFLKPGQTEFDEMEELGMNELCRVGIVLIAGGLGERLGFSSIKISLPVTTVTKALDEDDEYCYLRYYAEYALAMKKRALARDESLDKDSFYVPFAIMVSDDTYDRTIGLLEANQYFGLGKDRVDIVKQENVPAMIDNSAKIAFSSEGKIETKPHGHGDIHNLLFDSGVATKWRDMGKQWMIFIQDTNALALKVLPSILGVSAQRNWEMNSVCVPRRPGEAMGAICKLKNENDSDKEVVINVEYNQLESLLKAKWNPEGDISNDDGFSHFPGNTNTLVFKIPEYVENLTRTGGVIPEFVNPKYANAERTVFKSPSRLECMMQDYPKLLIGGKDRVGFTMYEPWFCFSPAKNNCADAVNCFNKSLPPFSAASAEWDMYYWNNRMMAEHCGVKIDLNQEPQEFAGIPWKFGPKIFLEPSFAITLAELRAKFQNIDFSVSKEVTLVLGGEAFTKSSERVEYGCGSVVARKEINFFEHYRTENVVFEPAEESDHEIFKIRGYKPVLFQR